MNDDKLGLIATQISLFILGLSIGLSIVNSWFWWVTVVIVISILIAMNSITDLNIREVDHEIELKVGGNNNERD